MISPISDGIEKLMPVPSSPTNAPPSDNDGALDDDAVDRRDDAGARQIDFDLPERGPAPGHAVLRTLDLRPGDSGLGRLEVLFGARQGGQGAVGLALGNEALGHQAQVALVYAARFGQIALRARHRSLVGRGSGPRGQHRGAGHVQVGLGAAQAVFKGLGGDLGDQLAGPP